MLKIIAIGGGGFTQDTNPSLDDFCLKETGTVLPRIGFIGTASKDDPVKIDRFHKRFANAAKCTIAIPMDLGAGALADAIGSLDLVYVGGGDTEAMVAEWRSTGWDQALRTAARSGLTLAGVSAGAVCWFDHFLFSSGSGPMRPLRGLGLVEGGACPHYSTEPERKDALHRAVAAGKMPDTIAIDDGVAVAFGADGPTAIHTAVPDGSAYRIARVSGGTTAQTRLTDAFATLPVQASTS